MPSPGKSVSPVWAGVKRRERLARRVALLAVLLALVYRVADVPYGLPYAYHHDEPLMVEGSLRMAASQSLRPPFVEYPALYPYLLLFLYGMAFLWAKVFGHAASPADFGAQYYIDPSLFFLIGRGASTLFGCITVFLVYRIGARLFGQWAGAAGALLIAFSTVHQIQSVLALPNAAMTFTAALALLFTLRVYDQGRVRDYLLAGVTIAASVSFKYNTALLVLPLLAAHFLAPRGRPLRNLLLSLLIVPVLFLLFNPYWLLDFSRHFDAFRLQASHMRIGHPGHLYGPPYLWYPMKLLSDERVVGCAILAGLVVSVIRRRRGDLLLLSFMIPSLLLILPLRNQGLDYTVGLLPALAVVGGRAVNGLLREVSGRWGTVLAVAAAVLLLTPPSFHAGRRLYRSHLPDTRTIAKEWIDEKIPSGSGIGYDRELYNPQPTRADRLEGKSFGGKYLSEPTLGRAREALRGKPVYNMVSLRVSTADVKWPDFMPKELQDRFRSDLFVRKMFRARFLSLDELRERDVQYFLVSGYTLRAAYERRRYPPDSPVCYITLRDKRYYEAIRSAPGVTLIKRWEPGAGVQGPAIEMYRIE